MIPKSYDVIGDIAILKFPEKFKGKKKVANALMKKRKKFILIVDIN